MISDAAHRTVPALLARAAEHYADRPALSDEHDTVSFGALATRVARAAAALAAAGIGHGDRVAVVLPSSTAFVEATLGVLAAGAAAFPITAAARPAELRRLLAATPVAGLVAPTDVVAALPAEGAALVPEPGGLAVARRRRAAPAAAAPAPGDPALAAYSSGTVAPPHLVVRTHENLWWEAENLASATGFDPTDVVLGIVPLSHAHGFGNALLASLRAGAHLIVRPRFHRRQTLELLERARVTVFPTVPFVVRMLATGSRGRRCDLGALRWCVSAGAPLARDVFDAFHDRFGVRVRQLYGLTEAGSVTLNAAPAETLDPASVGTPLGTTRVTVEDADGRALPAGAEGEVVVWSAAAAGGAAAPLRTRDRGVLDAAGALRVTGRTSLFINSAGNKVDPAEVERVLGEHPAVAEAAVFGVPAPHGEELVAAAVVLRAPCGADALRLHCRSQMAAYKVPRLIRVRRALPRSPLGKVLIGRLIAEAAGD